MHYANARDGSIVIGRHGLYLPSRKYICMCQIDFMGVIFFFRTDFLVHAFHGFYLKIFGSPVLSHGPISLNSTTKHNRSFKFTKVEPFITITVYPNSHDLAVKH